MKIQCQWCRAIIDDDVEKCPHCGGLNPHVTRTADGIPKTIEELLYSRNVVRFVIDEAHCFSAWGQDKVQELDKYQVGDSVKVSFNVKGREYNGRWYNDLRVWRIAPAGAAPAAAPAAPAGTGVGSPACAAGYRPWRRAAPCGSGR